MSRNHQGRRGTTADIGDNLLPSLTVFGCSLTAVEVETGPLSDVVFPSFLLPSSFSFPWYSTYYGSSLLPKGLLAVMIVGAPNVRVSRIAAPSSTSSI